jgi:hypothetical protein
MRIQITNIEQAEQLAQHFEGGIKNYADKQVYFVVESLIR